MSGKPSSRGLSAGRQLTGSRRGTTIYWQPWDNGLLAATERRFTGSRGTTDAEWFISYKLLLTNSYTSFDILL
jgi:hypothetical protein